MQTSTNRLKKNWLPYTLVLIGICIFFRSPTDPDFGWHYKYGEYFVKNKSLLKANIFSYTYSDYSWVNTYWLYEVFIYLTHSSLGHILPTFILSAIAATLLLTFSKKVTKNPIITTAIYLLMATNLSIYSITVRPHYFSTIFMYVLTSILLYKPAYQKWLPLMFVLWTNLHADFTLGLFVWGVYILWITIKNVKNSDKRRVWEIFGTLIKTSKYLLMSSAATLINPYGIEMWITLLKELTLPIKSYVVEWTAFRVEDTLTLGFLGFTYALFLIGGLSGRKKFGIWYAIIIVFFFVFSIKAAYMARVFFIIASFGLAESMDEFFTKLFEFLGNKNYKIIKVYSTIFLVLLTISLTLHFVLNVFKTQDTRLWSISAKYPYGAVEYVKNNPIKGNVLNHYNWGGYLIWQLPEYKTFIDGRMTSWREENKYFMDDYYKIAKEPEKNKELLQVYIEKYQITWVLEEPDNELAQYLIRAGWEKTYEDDYSLILLKNR